MICFIIMLFETSGYNGPTEDMLYFIDVILRIFIFFSVSHCRNPPSLEMIEVHHMLLYISIVDISIGVIPTTAIDRLAV